MNPSNALRAIRARIDGEWDHPALRAFGAVTFLEENILHILNTYPSVEYDWEPADPNDPLHPPPSSDEPESESVPAPPPRKRTISTRLMIRTLHQLQDDVHTMAQEKGWWDDARNDGEMIALIHSELSEALEGLRYGNPPSETIGGHGFSQAEEELADVLIRMLDLCGGRDWDLAGATLAKITYNDDRPYRHNKNF